MRHLACWRALSSCWVYCFVTVNPAALGSLTQTGTIRLSSPQQQAPKPCISSSLLLAPRTAVCARGPWLWGQRAQLAPVSQGRPKSPWSSQPVAVAFLNGKRERKFSWCSDICSGFFWWNILYAESKQNIMHDAKSKHISVGIFFSKIMLFASIQAITGTSQLQTGNSHTTSATEIP